MRILILAPHIDDGEIGCGGTMAKYQIHELFYAAFSLANQPILKDELKNAMNIFGIPEDNIIIFNFKVRDFPFYRQKILDKMIALNKQIKPDLIFLPSTFDTHQDHQVISQEGFRAFKKTSILGYEEPWNNLNFQSGAFSILEEEHLNKKIEALNCYKSQSNKNVISPEVIKSLAITRGAQIGVPYAESFELIRWILK